MTDKMSSRLLGRQLRALLAQSPPPPGIPRSPRTILPDLLARRAQHAGLLAGVPRGRQVRNLEEIITELHRLEGLQAKDLLEAKTY